MRSKSGIKIRGVLTYEARDLEGRLVQAGRSKNLVVNSGLNLIRDMVAGDFHKAPSHLWIGTNTTAAAATDTTATITAPYKKIITARTRMDKSVSIQTFIGTSEGNGVTYNEAGMVTTFNGTDTLFARTVITPIVKTASISVTLTWVFTLGAS